MFFNDPTLYPYKSQRKVVYSRQGMVATSQPLAAQAGLDIIKKGGNAIDAAVATAAALTVVEPTSNGIGSDAFALVWTKNKLHGLNASGTAPMSLSIETLKERGITEIPRFGFIPVTVPGTPSAWVELNKRFGKLPLKEVLKPAIEIACEGFPLTPTVAHYWNSAFNIYKKELTSSEYSHWFTTFAPKGIAPKCGEVWKSIAHANTLQLIADTNGEAFYRGEIAEKIDSFFRQYNGFLKKSDLENYKPEWVDPINVNYKGYNVWEIPPNGQGLVALIALNILKNDIFNNRDDINTIHKQIEAIKLAFADGLQYITEEKLMKYSIKDLLSDEYAKERRNSISNNAALSAPGNPPKGGTVYLATADGEGNMVSYIQSNYMGFGSGLVVPDTGIALQNRGHNFSLNPNHDNALAGGKRPYHTIIPGFLTKDKEAVGPFGVMGGFMQPQGHLQVIMNSIDFHLNPQAALDAPRWQWLKDKQVTVEQSMPEHIINGLIDKGHQIRIDHNSGSFGRGQIIWRNNETGVLVGGTESRCDGSIAIW